MERFAFKIDAALKANLYKICRLCGIDNPGKVQILPQNGDDIIDLDEPSLSQKVYELVGFMVSGDDKMPQTMCSLCVDKINDFYEFREMCYATNKQTRNLLGLKAMEPEKLIKLKPIIKAEPQLMGPGGKRGRKRKTEDNWPRANLSVKAQVKKEPVAFHKKLRLQPAQSAPIEPKTEPVIKEEAVEPETSQKVPPKKGRKSICSVCGEKFLSKELADEHKSLVHVPSILRYVCNACNQTHHNQSDIRAHQLWHKLSKTPYKCPLCEASVANAYAFTRHLREHTPPTPVQLLVLDRECPLCKKTFVTNFFYNTHRCAIRKRKCGGCSRALNSEAAYMRHAPTCAKIYLSHSKHIMPEVVTNEAQMRITNEVEEDLVGLPPATAMPPDFVIDEGMQPVVVLERLSSPLLRASTTVNRLGTSKGRNSERVSAKKYLKRVDQLLKNTMSTLVSIKHEPEVHISDTGPTGEHVEPEPEGTEEEPPSFADDDFHAGNDDSDEDQNLVATSSEYAAIASDNVPSVSVKQELLDEAYERQLEVKQEPLKLKLKITKNHGKLNSSIIDDLDEAGPASGRSGKKKKKRKHRDREKEPSVEGEARQDQAMVNVKQEPPDNDYVPQATVMTTIPITQLESSYNEGEQHEEQAEEPVPIQEDVKPNRVELDRMMQISHVASGVDVAEEAMPLEREEQAVEATPDEPEKETEKPKESPPKTRPTSVKSTARKSTGGVQRKPRNETPEEAPLPQIVAVESGEAVSFNMIQDVNIKPEPRNRGYGDDEPEVTEEINHNEKMDEENAFIDRLDLNNVTVKQEKDLDISHEEEAMHCNGLDKVAGSEGDDDGHEDSMSSADEAEEAMEEDEEERIYREIELPPLEAQTDADKATQLVPEEPCLPASELVSEQPPLKPATETATIPVPAFSLVITNICSQAAPDLAKVSDQSQSTVDLEPTLDNIPASTIESQSTLGTVGRPAHGTNDASVPVVDTPTDFRSNQSPECLSVHEVVGSILTDENPSLAVLDPQIEISSNMTVESQCRSDFDSNPPTIEPPTKEDIGSTQPLRLESLEHEGSIVEELPAAIEDRFLAGTHAHPSLFESQPANIHEIESLPCSSSNIQDTGSPSPENISLPHINPALESLEKPGSDHATATTLPMVSLNGPKDNETQALPVYEAPNFICDEEQQNVLNQEISEQQQASLDDGQLLVFEEQPATLETGQESTEEQEDCKPGPSTRPIEETENRINEQQQHELALEDQRQPRCQANNDDSNINEIAENNNNANIERELQDDALGGAQEAGNP